MKDEKLQSRREFFKNAAKSSLPILAGALLANVPIISNAAKHSMNCDYYCSGGCTNGCGGCDSSCKGECTWTCSGSCKEYCTGGCQGTCRTECYGTCKTQCVMLTR